MNTDASGKLGAVQRVDRYRRELAAYGFEILQLQGLGRYTQAEIAAVRPQLAVEFRTLSDDDLAVTGSWLVCRRPS